MQEYCSEKQAALEAECKQMLAKSPEKSSVTEELNTNQLQEIKPSKFQVREGVDPVGSENTYYWTDSENRVCVEYFAKAHEIADSGNPDCWKFVTEEIRPKIYVQCAELLKSSRLEVKGHHDITKLTPKTKYKVFIDVVIKPLGVVGWEHPVKIEFTDPYGNSDTTEVKLDEYKGLGQKKIKIAEFLCNPHNSCESCSPAAKVYFRMYAPENHSKSGLIFRGVIIHSTN